MVSREFERKYVLPVVLVVCAGFIVVEIVDIVKSPGDTLPWSMVFLFAEIAGASSYYAGFVRRGRANAALVLAFHVIGFPAAVGFWVAFCHAPKVDDWFILILCVYMTFSLPDKTVRTLWYLFRRRT